MDTQIFYIDTEVLEDTALFGQLRSDCNLTYYWSDDWSPELYVALAREGFISVTLEHEEMGQMLLPELQASYALLEWDDLHISKKVKKLARRLIGENSSVELSCNSDISRVVSGIHRQFGENCWLSEPYVETIQLAQKARLLQLCAFELTIDGELVAGEIGYSFGSVYTSLTGFYDRKKECYANVGTLQLVLLARWLEQGGFAFWNLGHPQLEYKMRLGAQEVERAPFLSRWELACNEPDCPLSSGESFMLQEADL